jgi:putative ABC transport system permease protein
MGAIVASGATRPNPKPLLLVAGLLAVVLGVILASPGAIRLAAVPARWAPLATRLALRDLARYRARASAALAAVTLGLGIAAGVVVIAGATASHDSSAPNLPANEVLVHAGGFNRQQAAPPNADPATLDAAAATVAAALGDGATTLPLDVAVSGSSSPPLAVGVQLDPHSLELIGPAYVSTPELLAHYGIDAASIPAGTSAITSRTDHIVIVDPGVGRDDGDGQPATRVAGLPGDSSDPNTLVTESAMQRFGWQARRVAWLITLPGAPTAAQLDAARTAAARAGYAIETRQAPASRASLQDWATIIGIVLALLIIVMSIGLLRSESAGDVRTLTANGAPTRVRRSIAASTAGTLALLGAVLGVLGAYLAAISAFHADLSRLTPVPVTQLLGILVGLPVLAAALAWLAAGRQPSTISRRSLD